MARIEALCYCAFRGHDGYIFPKLVDIEVVHEWMRPPPLIGPEVRT